MILVDRIAVLFGFFLVLPILWRGHMISFADAGEWSMVELFGGFWIFVFVTLRLFDWVCGGPARRTGRITAPITD